MGAWIEIIKWVQETLRALVAPFVGAWIEIWNALSPGTQEAIVAPFVGAWIEIFDLRSIEQVPLVASFAGV